MRSVWSIPRTVAACGAIVCTGAVAPSVLIAQAKGGAATKSGEVPAAMSQIREADLKRDLYAMASDGMRGRESGTPDEMRASSGLPNNCALSG